MSPPNQTDKKFRLGPCTPEFDPFGKAAWDSKCDLYDITSTTPPNRVAFGEEVAPVIAPGGPEPAFSSQIIFGVVTPPSDRFALYCVYRKQAAFSAGVPVKNSDKPSPWTIGVRRGVDCLDEPNASAFPVIYAPKTFDDLGFVIEIVGAPLSTWWVVQAFQTTTPGTDIAWQGIFRVIVDRIGACCAEDSQLGPNTTIPP